MIDLHTTSFTPSSCEHADSLGIIYPGFCLTSNGMEVKIDDGMKTDIYTLLCRAFP